MAVKVKPGMYCERCDKPIAAQKQTHKARSLLLGPLTYGAAVKIGEWHCPNCGGPVTRGGPAEKSWFTRKLEDLEARVPVQAVVEAKTTPRTSGIEIAAMPRRRGKRRLIIQILEYKLDRSDLAEELEVLPRKITTGFTANDAQFVAARIRAFGGEARWVRPDGTAPARTPAGLPYLPATRSVMEAAELKAKMEEGGDGILVVTALPRPDLHALATPNSRVATPIAAMVNGGEPVGVRELSLVGIRLEDLPARFEGVHPDVVAQLAADTREHGGEAEVEHQ